MVMKLWVNVNENYHDNIIMHVFSPNNDVALQLYIYKKEKEIETINSLINLFQNMLDNY